MKIVEIGGNISLVPLAMEDAQALFDIIDSEREYLGEWLPFVALADSVEYTRSFIELALSQPAHSCDPLFTIRQEGEVIGIVGFKCTDRFNRRTEIGYWLSESAQGRGIMTNSVRALCSYAFEGMGINRIQIKCAVGNTPSSAIPKRLGFSFEGVERDGEFFSEGKFFDVEVYSLLRREFE